MNTKKIENEPQSTEKIKYPQITQITQISGFGLGKARQLKCVSSPC
jgi:hypothetical protein